MTARFEARLAGCSRGRPIKMRVYGGTLTIDGKARRVIICAQTMKRAVELLAPLGVSQHTFRHWWCESSNAIERAAGAERQDKVLYATVAWPASKHDYAEVRSGN